MALFWSRALIGQQRVTTRSRAAGRGREEGEGRFRRPRRVVEWGVSPRGLPPDRHDGCFGTSMPTVQAVGCVVF